MDLAIFSALMLIGTTCASSAWIYYDGRMRVVPKPIQWSLRNAALPGIAFIGYLSERRKAPAAELNRPATAVKGWKRIAVIAMLLMAILGAVSYLLSSGDLLKEILQPLFAEVPSPFVFLAVYLVNLTMSASLTLSLWSSGLFELAAQLSRKAPTPMNADKQDATN